MSCFTKFIVLAVVVVAAAAVAWFLLRGGDPTGFASGKRVDLADFKGANPTGVPSSLAQADLVARGEYLTRAADCAACHTAPGGKPFAGGLAFKLPMIGSIYSTNITPDPETGIAQNAALKEHQEQIAANTARFGQLNDYYIFEEVTVLFANGKTKVNPKYNPQLVALAEKAKSVKGYMIQVKGFASSSGSATFNQQLSDNRANNVTNILLQQGHVPLTNLLAPGAMGESHQVGNDKSAEGEAQNRRVVVRVLQNKGIAGM